MVAGASREPITAKLKQILPTPPFLNVTESIWWRVGEYRNKMRRGGFTAGLPDTIIAAVAIYYETQLFTLDSHFAHIEKFVPLDLLKKHHIFTYEKSPRQT
jgi:predicted nucleic acid-binding protein